MIRPDFQPQRLAGETQKAYRVRRRTVNRAIKAYLRGRLAYASTQPVFLPDREALIDVQSDLPMLERVKRWADGEPRVSVYYKDTEEGRRADAAILAGHIRDVKIDKTLPGNLTRVGHTKGVSYTTTPYIEGTKRCQRALLREFRVQ